MISQISGTLVSRELDRVDIATPGGVTYELLIPLGVYETLPHPGESVMLHTHLVVKEDGSQVFFIVTAHPAGVATIAGEAVRLSKK